MSLSNSNKWNVNFFVKNILTTFHSFSRFVDTIYFMPKTFFDELAELRYNYQEYSVLKQDRYKNLRKINTHDKSFETLMSLHRAIREEFPENKFDAVLSTLRHLELAKISRKIMDLHDLISVGYKESDIWNLSHSIARKLGAQMIELAKLSHAYPEIPQVSNLEDWQEMLVLHGRALLAYANNEGTQELSQRFDEAVIAGDKFAEKFSLDLLSRHEAELESNASKAYLFLAEYHTFLWD